MDCNLLRKSDSEWKREGYKMKEMCREKGAGGGRGGGRAAEII